MAIWLDVIGSFVFGSLLLLNVLRMNADMTAQSYRGTLTYGAQYSAVSIAETVDDDFRRMGFGVSGTAVTLADSAQIRFLVDLGADSAIDTLYYYAGGPSEVSATPTPGDRFLYRVINSDPPQKVGAGLTTFLLSYFDVDGNALGLPATLGDIRQIRLGFTVESSAPYDATYAQAFMELRIRPKNL